jgi:hypothetical protein
MLVGVLDYMTLEGLEGDRRRYGEVRAYVQAGNALASLFMG